LALSQYEKLGCITNTGVEILVVLLDKIGTMPM
jgi:hypothetical protein